MKVKESSTHLRQKVARRMSGSTEDLPVSTLSRLQQASGVAAQGGFRRLVHALPGTAPETTADQRATERIVTSLGRLKGVPMKLGQVASYVDSTIPEGLRPAFASLENQAQALPYARIRRVVDRQLGPNARELLASMSAHPFAVASVGQVHRAEVDGVPVAVKIKYPGIEKAIRLDFGPAAVGTRAMMGFRRRGKRGDRMVRDIMGRILEECDYLREADRQAAFARCFEDHPVLEIPAVFSKYSSAGVLTTRLVEGLSLDAFLAKGPSANARRRAAIALFEFYVGSFFLMGAYNSDPHPGNYLFLPNGRIAVLDHGAGRTFESKSIVGIRALARAALADDLRAAREALHALGVLPMRRRVDEAPLREVLAWLFGPMRAPGETAFVLPRADEVRRIIRHVRDFDALAKPGELVFMVRSRLALTAVLTRLEARANWREVLQTHLDGRFYLPPPTFDVVLADPGPRPIELLRALRDELGGAVREAQALIDAAPCVVRSDLARKTAKAFGARLGTAGAKVELRQRAEA